MQNRQHTTDTNTITVKELDKIISRRTSSDTMNKEMESDGIIGNIEEHSDMIDTSYNSRFDNSRYKAFRKIMGMKMAEYKGRKSLDDDKENTRCAAESLIPLSYESDSSNELRFSSKVELKNDTTIVWLGAAKLLLLNPIPHNRDHV